MSPKDSPPPSKSTPDKSAPAAAPTTVDTTKLEARAVEAEARAEKAEQEVAALRKAADEAAAQAKVAADLEVKSPRKGSKLTLVALRRIGVGPNPIRPRQGGVYEPGEEFQAQDEDAFERLQRIGAALTPGDYRKFKLEN